MDYRLNKNEKKELIQMKLLRNEKCYCQRCATKLVDGDCTCMSCSNYRREVFK